MRGPLASAWVLAAGVGLAAALASAQEPRLAQATAPGRLIEEEEEFEPSQWPTDAGRPTRRPAASAAPARAATPPPTAPDGGAPSATRPSPSAAQGSSFVPAPFPEPASNSEPPAITAAPPPPPPPAQPLVPFPSPPTPFGPPPIFPPAAVKPAPLVLPPGGCSLAGDGDVERCRLWYRRTRLLATFLPHYSLQVGDGAPSHGLAWNVALEIPRANWRSLFLLGAEPTEALGINSFLLGFAGGVAWYPGRSFEGRATMRLRVVSMPDPSAAGRSWVHVTVGLGAFVSSQFGPGPRLEVRLRVGRLTWGGVVLSMAYQAKLPENVHLGDFSLGFEGPWVWWW